MNRLILIGNGFDLAHGLKTSYHDFILDYLKGCIKKALDDLKIKRESRIFRVLYFDDLIEIRVLNTDNYYYETHPIKNIEEIKHQTLYVDSIKNIEILIKSINVDIKYLGDGFSESMFNELITNNWVDVESIYYQELKKIIPQFQDYKSGKNRNDHVIINRIRNLNKQLDFIKDKLKEYLTKVQSEGFQRIDEIEKIIYNTHPVTNTPNKILFLNFNYTNIAEKYATTTNADLINIHGQLLDISNEIIFGYGDEVDKNYKEIEDLNENEFFKHIKSFDYFKTSNYKDLLRFINDDLFEVFVMGHSCGLSDRTLLSSIFEDKNCLSIKIFDYRKDPNNYRDKTYEISRHFKDKESMRRKIVELKKCSPMPQHDEK